MTIKAVIRKIGLFRIMQDVNTVTLPEVIGNHDGRSKIIITCETKDEEVKYYDLCAILSDQPVWVNDVKDWASLEVYFNNLISTVLNRYIVHVVVPDSLLIKEGNKLIFTKNPYPSTQSKQLRIWSLDHHDEVSMDYGYHMSPNVINNKTLKHVLNDIVFTSSVGTGKINLRNSVPVINGIVCYPIYSGENRMYAVNGKYYFRKRNPITTNSILIDFSPFGDIQTIKFSDCTLVSIHGFEEKTYVNGFVKGNPVDKTTDTDLFIGSDKDHDYRALPEIKITFDLPEGSTGIPILSMFGRLFTSSSCGKIRYFKYDNTIRVVFTIKHHELEQIFISNCMKTRQKIKDTPFYLAILKENIERMFGLIDPLTEDSSFKEQRNQLFDFTIPFVVLVNTDKDFDVAYSSPIINVNHESLFFKPNSGGILINSKTYEIIDYVKVPYKNGTLCTFYHSDPLYKIENDNLKSLTNEQFYTEALASNIGDKVDTEDLHDTKNLLLMDFFYEVEPGDTPESDTTPDIEVPIIPEDEDIETGTDIGILDDTLIPGYSNLVAGTRVKIDIVAKSMTHLQVSGILEDMCGDYTALISTSSFKDQKWYLNGNSDSFAIYQMNNFWYIGREGYNPIYQSTDIGKGIQPWYSDMLAWFVGSTVNTEIKSDDTLDIVFVDLNTIQIPTGKGKITGTYHLVDSTTKFADRVWKCDVQSIFYDADECCWVITNDGVRVYKSSTAMPGSSPWHHLVYEYLLEE